MLGRGMVPTFCNQAPRERHRDHKNLANDTEPIRHRALRGERKRQESKGETNEGCGTGVHKLIELCNARCHVPTQARETEAQNQFPNHERCIALEARLQLDGRHALCHEGGCGNDPDYDACEEGSANVDGGPDKNGTNTEPLGWVHVSLSRGLTDRA